MPTLLKVTNLVLAVALLGAASPSVAGLDAVARAAGNDKPTAVQIGERLFTRKWPAQVLKVHVDRAGAHRVAGLTLSGVKFHQPLTRSQFGDEVVALVEASFAAAPVEEVDVWCVVPLSVGRGVVVSGDHAMPTQRIVFTVSVVRRETAGALKARITTGKNVYWDSTWARQALTSKR